MESKFKISLVCDIYWNTYIPIFLEKNIYTPKKQLKISLKKLKNTTTKFMLQKNLSQICTYTRI